MTRRFDVVLRVVSGPTASPEEHVLGPSVVLGSAPGSRLDLSLARGVAALHCRLTAKDARTAELTPIGDNPVRISPYVPADWDALEPLREPRVVVAGTVLHLGPTGSRGVTLELVGCRDLGDVQGDLSSVVPDSFAARRQRPSVYTILAAGAGSPLVRWATLGAFLASAVMLGVAGVLLVLARSEPSEQPVDDGWRTVFVDDADVADNALSKHHGFQAPLHDFLFAPDAALAGGEVDGLDLSDPASWDPRLVAAIVKQTRAAAKTWYFRRYDEIEPSFRAVVEQLEAAKLPVVLAGVPMHESCYNAKAVSEVCAYGWWQFMPEFGFRYKDEGYQVAECRFRNGRPTTYTPAQVAPPGMIRLNAPYYDRDREGCALQLPCGTDFRSDLAASTAVASLSLGEVLAADEAKASGAAVQLAIASHHAGWDDEALLGSSYGKKWNVRRALGSWTGHREALAARGQEAPPVAHFLGDAMRCSGTDQAEAGCAAYLHPATQTYVPAVVANFLLGVCYYAKNADAFGWPEAGEKWGRYLADDGFCRELRVLPTRDEVKAVRFDAGVRWCRRS